MKWNTCTEKQEVGLVLPNDWVFPHYLEAYNLLFRIENALRVLVYVVLKNEYGEKWIDQNVTTDESGNGSIKNLAKRRVEHAANHGYLCVPASCETLYLNSGELIGLMTNDANWKFFKCYFKANKAIVKHKLDEISCIRNSLAHFRPLNAGDVGVLKQNAEHLLPIVESFLANLMGYSKSVPTNCTEAWYKSLASFSGFNLSETSDKLWVKVCVDFNLPVIGKAYGHNTWAQFSVMNINSESLLDFSGNMRNSVIYCMERYCYGQVNEEDKLTVRKNVVFCFSRLALSANCDVILAGFNNIISKVNEEIGMLQKDPGAMGNIVSIGSVNISRKKEGDQWAVSTDSIQNKVRSDSPSEFWLNVYCYDGDYISNAQRYPWMSVDVANPLF